MTDQLTFPDRHRADDEFLWLEEIYDEQALAWVAEQNERTRQMLTSPEFDRTYQRTLEVLDSTDRIPDVTKRGDSLYNFWKDADHPRGLWRRTTLNSYRTDFPDWETLLDVDGLCRTEGVQWVFAGAQLLYPDFTRALLRLSPDGGDAVAIREYDLPTRAFVTDGFILPSAKSAVSWVDRDSVLVSTDFGPGTLTSSSYPRQVRRWRRAEPIESAELLLEIPVEHMIATGWHDHTPGFERDLLREVIEFFTSRTYLLKDGERIHIDVPDDADVELHREWMLVRPKGAWAVGESSYPAGTLLVAQVDKFLAGDRGFEVLFTPDDRTSLQSWSWTRNHLILSALHDVSSRITVLTPGANGWSSEPLAAAPPNHSVTSSGVDADENDDFWLRVAGFIQPATLQLGTIGIDGAETLKSAPAFFDSSRFSVEQHFVESNDGTRVPYFQIAPNDLKLDGRNPTLLYGYGGFEISLTPSYHGTNGRSWLERGGVLVVANIRGGGEYGPDWHNAALHANRHRAYEDFSSIAKDLIARGVTSPARLGCEGGSNGGLLVGNMLTHYPELFGAIVCAVPLLDMKRYTKLSAGFSWIAEYGDSDDPAQWEYIQTFSPYHNLRDGVTYPPMLFYTATSDDRVGPVQARKMAARMQARNIPGVWFYENREGGHGAASDNKQSAHMHAMSREFLWKHLTGNGGV